MKQTEKGTKLLPQWDEEHISKILEVEKEKNRAICGAHKKNDDRDPCAKTPFYKNGRCRLHGGPSSGPADQNGNTNAMKTGIGARKTIAGIYKEWRGIFPDEEYDPLVRTNYTLMIQHYLVSQYALKKRDNPSVEDIGVIGDAVEQLAKAELRFDISLQKRLKQQHGLSKEELDAMSPQERLKYINNDMLNLIKNDEYDFKSMFEAVSRSLKAEGDLAKTGEEDIGDMEINVTLTSKSDSDQSD